MDNSDDEKKSLHIVFYDKDNDVIMSFETNVLEDDFMYDNMTRNVNNPQLCELDDLINELKQKICEDECHKIHLLKYYDFVKCEIHSDLGTMTAYAFKYNTTHCVFSDNFNVEERFKINNFCLSYKAVKKQEDEIKRIEKEKLEYEKKREERMKKGTCINPLIANIFTTTLFGVRNTNKRYEKPEA